MLEAIVGVALRAILASVLLGGILAGLALLATRTLALNAATRHALWITALIATAVMPLAGVAVSLARAAAPSIEAAPPAAARATNAFTAQTKPLANATHGDGAATAGAHPASPSRAHSDTGSVATREERPGLAATPLSAPLNVNFMPRLSRTFALGVVAVWVTGALIGLIGLAASIARVRGLRRRSSPLDGELADELPWLTEVDGGREIYLRLSFEIETPVAIGFRRPVILIPTELATADGLAAIEQLVLHEYAHLRRYDDWTNLVQRTIERLFWFNPIVWILGRKIALEREIASDDAVVDKTGEAHAYATSLWKLAREMRMPEHAVVAPGALLTRKQITIRIEQLLDKKRSRLHRSPAAALGIGLAGMLAVAFVATSAPAVELPPEPTGGPLIASPASHAHSAVSARHPDPAKQRPAKVPDAMASTAHEQRIVQIVQTVQAPVTTQAPVATQAPLTAHPAKPPAKVLGNALGKAAPPAGGPKELAALPTSNGPPPPAVPAVAPHADPLAPLPAAPSFSPETLGKLRAATAAAARSHGERITVHVTTEVDRLINEVMGAIPREVAQEGGAPASHRVRLDGMKLTRDLISSCVGCSFRHADVRGADLHGLRINADDFTGADMRGANLSGAQLVGVSLANANLANADLRNAQFSGVELRGANFEGAQLDGIKLTGVSVRHVNLRGTLLRSVLASCTGCDFGHLDLHGQDLHGIALSGADLSYADLHDANLSGVRFAGVNLSHTNLSGADLTNARLEGCDLSAVNLHGARTSGMTMQGSGFDG